MYHDCCHGHVCDSYQTNLCQKSSVGYMPHCYSLNRSMSRLIILVVHQRHFILLSSPSSALIQYIYTNTYRPPYYHLLHHIVVFHKFLDWIERSICISAFILVETRMLIVPSQTTHRPSSYTPRPPSTSNTAPVTKELSSDPRYHAALAISPGCVALLMGRDSSIFRSRSWESTPFPILACSLPFNGYQDFFCDRIPEEHEAKKKKRTHTLKCVQLQAQYN